MWRAGVSMLELRSRVSYWTQIQNGTWCLKLRLPITGLSYRRQIKNLYLKRFKVPHSVLKTSASSSQIGVPLTTQHPRNGQTRPLCDSGSHCWDHESCLSLPLREDNQWLSWIWHFSLAHLSLYICLLLVCGLLVSYFIFGCFCVLLWRPWKTNHATLFILQFLHKPQRMIDHPKPQN